jgi:hypothetical protein
LQTLNARLTDHSYGGGVKKQLLLLSFVLVAVLVLSAQLARATAGPERGDPQDSLPAWSSDGTNLTFERAAGAERHVLQMTANGGDIHVVAAPNAPASVGPSRSPDGQTVAFERDGQIWLARADGSDPHELLGGAASDYRFPQFSPASGDLAYISDRQHVRGVATTYQYALYVGRRKLLDDVDPSSPPRWSPTAALIAVAAGQECRRWGIYVGNATAPASFHRRSNICRFTGTNGADRIGGSSYFDLIRGLGGDDVILARGGNDRIEGNDGNDRIAAGPGDDVLFGGPGDDRLSGGAGDDILIGGPGRDVLDCGPGDDTVEAVSRLDVVSRTCEHVGH